MMEELEQRLNNELKRKKNILNIINIIAVILCVIYIIIFINSFGKTFSFWVFLPAIFSMVLIALSIFIKNKLYKWIKNNVLEQIIPGLFENKKTIYVEDGISQKIFNDSGMYRNYNKYFSSDGIKDSMNNFCFANVTAIRKNEENKHTAFIGIFGYEKVDDFYENEILIKPDIENKYAKNLVNNKDKMLGNTSNVIRLENNEFERYFEVFSKDPIKARQLITTTYMENLLDIKKQIGEPIKIVYYGNKKYIAIWNKRIIEEKSIYKNGVNIKKIQERLEGIYKIFETA